MRLQHRRVSRCSSLLGEIPNRIGARDALPVSLSENGHPEPCEHDVTNAMSGDLLLAKGGGGPRLRGSHHGRILCRLEIVLLPSAGRQTQLAYSHTCSSERAAFARVWLEFVMFGALRLCKSGYAYSHVTCASHFHGRSLGSQGPENAFSDSDTCTMASDWLLQLLGCPKLVLTS